MDVATTIMEILAWILGALFYPKIFGIFPERVLFGTHPPCMPIPDPDMSDEELSRRVKELRGWLEDDKLLQPDDVFQPERAPLLDREQLLSSQHASQKHETRAYGHRAQKQVTIFGLDSFSSNTPLDQLTRISLLEMLVRKTHVGRFLLCRSIAQCSRRIGVQLVVEDPEGDVNVMTISNFPTAENRSPGYLDLLFPVGIVIAVREPTLTATNAAQLPHPVIRVDSPSDIVFLQPQCGLIQDVKWKTDAHIQKSVDTLLHAGNWKALGNRYFNAELWFPAAIAYSKGIDVDPAAYLLRLNRAEAYLRLGYYTAALADAEHVLALAALANSHRIKALSRSAKANYGRGDYAASERRYKEWVNFATLNKDEALAGVCSAHARLKESTTGQYDWTRLFKESQNAFRVDLADFVGPVKVETLVHRGGGRGVVATRNISFGEILVVAKPFVSVFPQDLQANDDLRAFDLRGNKFTTRCQTALVTRVVEKLYGNPEQYDNVTSLYSGPGGNPPPSYPSAREKEIRSVSPLTPSLDIDAGKIEAVCAFNNFTPNSLEIGPYDMAAEQPSALYLFPSLFNHACAANAVWRCIGDVMVIRATANIACGNEVTVPYVCSNSYNERRAALEVYIPQGCDCHLCKEDRQDGEEAVKRRETLLSEISRSHTAQISLAQARRLADDLAATYAPTRGSVRPQMSFARNLIAVSLQELAYDAEEQLRRTYFEEAIGELFMALECVGMRITDQTIRGAIRQTGLPVSTSNIPTITPHEQCILHMISIAYSFHILDDRQRTIRWLKAAAWVEKTALGVDKEIFLLRYSSLKHYGLHAIAVKGL